MKFGSRSADTITILSWLVQFVPWVGKASRKFLLSKFSGYMHCGNMRFLTSVSKGAYKDARLLYFVNLLTRILGVLKKRTPRLPSWLITVLLSIERN